MVLLLLLQRPSFPVPLRERFRFSSRFPCCEFCGPAVIPEPVSRYLGCLQASALLVPVLKTKIVRMTIDRTRDDRSLGPRFSQILMCRVTMEVGVQ